LKCVCTKAVFVCTERGCMQGAVCRGQSCAEVQEADAARKRVCGGRLRGMGSTQTRESKRCKVRCCKIARKQDQKNSRAPPSRMRGATFSGAIRSKVCASSRQSPPPLASTAAGSELSEAAREALVSLLPGRTRRVRVPRLGSVDQRLLYEMRHGFLVAVPVPRLDELQREPLATLLHLRVDAGHIA
jgi:hypothetical protein